MVKASALLLVAAFVPGCTFEPQIQDASVQMSGGERVVSVTLNRKDLAKIKNGQYHFSLVVSDCDKPDNGYPAVPYVNGRRVSDFEYSLPQAEGQINGTVPDRVLQRYQRPCVFIRGGGYLSGKIKSKMVALGQV